MKLYHFQTVDKLIMDYIEKGGLANQTNEGVLGSGDWVLSGLTVSFIVKEIFINPWESAHKIIKYKVLPKKYQKLIENY